MGTKDSYTHEWIELKNISNQEINLKDWQLLDKDEQIKIVFDENDKILSQGYFLLERKEQSVPHISADKIYTGSLNNKNESLRLFDSHCQLIDEVVAEPDWPGGDNDTKQTLERKPDLSWQTSANPQGTPKQENSQGATKISEPVDNSQTENLFKVKKVIDGDTIELENGEVVRYIGINAPENNECFFEQAKQMNRDLVEGKEVKLGKDVSDRDKYNRLLRYVYVDDIFVNDYLVKQGYALADFIFPDEKYKDQFEQSQTYAKENKLGLWGSACPPTADAGEDKVVQTNQSFTFDGSGSGDNIEIVSYKWDIDNDGIWDLEGEKPFFQGYTSAGVYTITLEVLDEAGNKDSDFLTVTVNSPVETQSEIREQLPELEITEIMYNPEGNDSGREWIEIKNKGDKEIDLTCLKFYEDKTNHNIVLFQGNEKLQPNEYAVISNNPEKFKEEFPDCISSLFKSSFNSLKNNPGEEIALKYNDEIIDQVEYSNTWGGNGNNKSLQKIDGQWLEENPSPGEENKKHINQPPSEPEPELEPEPENNPPAADFYFSGDFFVDDEITFDASSSTDPDGKIVSYNWDFGDGSSFSTIEKKVNHSFSKQGQYDVSLTVCDDKGAFSFISRTINIEIAPVREVNHIVISEVQFAGADAGDEFIELFNPTVEEVDLSDYSIQYASGASTTTTGKIYKKNFEPGNKIPSQGYFLIARKAKQDGTDGYTGSKTPDLYYRSFSLSGRQTGGTIFLVKNTDKIEKLMDQDIVDSLSYGSAILRREGYAALLPEPGQSLERKSLVNGACFASQNEYEFSGNGCDTDNNDKDFTIRENPNPQNTNSFPEPRKKPTVPSNFSVSFSSSTMTLNFSWDSSLDYQGTSNTIKYLVTDISNTSSTLTFSPTSQTYLCKQIQEIGRDYKFSVQALDRDGLSSQIASTEISVPSFLDKVYFYKHPFEDKYLVDLYFSEYPFVPDLFNQGKSWKGVEFYLNGKTLLDIRYNKCCDNPLLDCSNCKIDSILLLPDDAEHCKGGAWLGSSALSWEKWFSGEDINDHHFSFQINIQEPSPSDYLTLKFYSINQYNWRDNKDLYFVAQGKTKYYFSKEFPEHLPPQKPKNLNLTFYQQQEEPYLLITWDESTDPDSLDGNITYHLKISQNTSSTLLGYLASKKEVSNNQWIKVNNLFQFYPLNSGKYTFSLKACDEFNLCSNPSVTSTSVIVPVPLAKQDKKNDSNFYSGSSVGQYQQFAQTFVLNNDSQIYSLKLSIAGDNNSQVKVSIKKGEPDEQNETIYSFVIPSLRSYNRLQGNFVSYYFPSPLSLNKGKYSLILQPIQSSIIVRGESSGRYYPQGCFWGYANSQWKKRTHRYTNKDLYDLYFIIKGVEFD